MSGKAALLLVLFPMLLSFRGDRPRIPDSTITRLYTEANKLYEDVHANNSTYQRSLQLFAKLIEQLERPGSGHAFDSLLFQSYIRKGILKEVLGGDYTEAKKAYRLAIDLQKKNPSIPDSLVFRVYSYAGACYYNLNNFDSANYFLLQGRRLLDRFPNLSEKENLFNTLGVLYYDNGNYIQSRNYFNEALDIIQRKKNPDTTSLASIQTNIATALYRSGFYAEALSSYSRIMKFHVLADLIYMNMGRAHLALGQLTEALDCFRKVDASKLPWVFNEIGYAQIQLNRPDSALFFLNAFDHVKDNGKTYAIDHGINELYRAELMSNQGQFIPALEVLQKAICIFSGHFSDQAIASNPSSFTGTFASYRLFDALAKKANVLQLLYEKEHQEADLTNAFSAYQSSLALLSYIEKSYDTDDAKLFLKKKSGQVRQQAFEVCIALHKLHPGKRFLEEAFRISEKNKASIVSASLKERGLESGFADEQHWLQAERNIKFNIARLNIQSDQSQDSLTIERTAKEKASYEIQLGDLQKKMEENSRYYQNKYDDSYPSISDLQGALGDKQALISFYNSGDNLHAFILTNVSFQYLPIEGSKGLQLKMQDWIRALKSPESGRKFKGGETGKLLYEKLIRPIESLTAGKDEWIIIPDGILYLLPFESLPGDADQNSLLESHAVSYQFSSRFVVNQTEQTGGQTEAYQVLGFAPFVHQGERKDGLDQLDASGEEINGLPGKLFIGPAATKDQFLAGINQFPIMHLATHALSDIRNTSASYIAFYPREKSKQDNFLFLEELYGLNMDHTKLVILSACETGKGELIDNEGVMSISRAFIYAGCSSVVTSLWKADDRSTAAILKQFHFYLQKGFSKPKALQRAKLDYIHSQALYRTPEYWSHLVLIGNPEPLVNKKQPYRWAVIIASLCIVGLGLIKLKRQRSGKEKKVDAFHGQGILN